MSLRDDLEALERYQEHGLGRAYLEGTLTREEWEQVNGPMPPALVPFYRSEREFKSRRGPGAETR